MSNLFDKYRPPLPAKQVKPERRCNMCGYWKPVKQVVNGMCKPCLSYERNRHEKQ